MKLNKRLISIAKILLPAIIVLFLCFTLRGYGRILYGVYIIFPLIYILMGVMASNKGEFLIGVTLVSAIFIFSMYLWYGAGDLFFTALMYIVYGTLSYILKCLLRKHLARKHGEKYENM